MRRRPLILPIIGMILATIALVLPMQIVWIYGHGLNEIGSVLTKMTSLNWMVVALSGVSAYLLTRASPWAMGSLPLLILTVAVNNWLVGYYATDFSPVTANLATFGFIVLHAPLLHPNIVRLLRHPEQRWWLRAERRRASVPIFIGGSRKVVFRAETFDLSESGAFIPLETVQSHASGPMSTKPVAIEEVPATHLAPEERVSICMTLGIHSQIRCQGRVIRKTDARGLYPAGIGIQFVDLPPNDRKELRKYLARQVELVA